MQSVLHDRLGVSHAEARGLVAAGAVSRNGRVVQRPDERVEGGDRIDIRRDPTRRYHAPKRDVRRGDGYRILHEDDHLVVVDKAPGLLTVPTPTESGRTLVELLRERYRRRGHRDPDVRVVHRIDRFTSGIVVFARHPAAFVALRREFAAGRPQRVYLALAEGRLERDAGRLVHRLAEHPKSLKVSVVPDDAPGRRASCRYRVRERFSHATLLEIELETGRRNQIRVQLAAEGHPLVGDVAHGNPSPHIDRVALHAWRLGLDAPGGQRLELRVDPPKDFDSAVEAMRRGAVPSAPKLGDAPRETVRPRRTPRRERARRNR